MEEKVMTTKEKILITSLRLFSEKGYNGVSMREIASAVGIKGASIYSHYKGKQDIFEGIFEELEKRYEKQAMELKIPKEPGIEASNFFKGLDEENLLTMSKSLFDVFVKDEFIVMFRKLLVSEQHKNEMAAKFLKSYYLESPIEYQTHIFEKMQQMGAFEGYDSSVMALHFYSPIYYLICTYDLGADYNECVTKLREHVISFCKIYNKNKLL